MSKDFYAVLSMPRNATQAQIRSRFLEIARESHPDRFKGEEKVQAEKAFQEFTEAFNVLSDPDRRRRHDLELDRPAAGPVHDPEKASRVYINRGIRAYRQENYIEAANNFDRAIQASPDNHQAWHHLALTCMQEERWLPKARDAIVRACELRPQQVAYLKLAGKIFLQSGLVKEAKRYYNDALRLDDNDPTIHKALQALAGTLPMEGASRKQENESGKTSGLFRKLW